MNNFQTLFEMDSYISWDSFLFKVMLFIIILGFFIVSIRSKNEGSILKIILGFLLILFMSFTSVLSSYQSNMQKSKVWERYQNGDYKIVEGKVDVFQKNYKNKTRYDYFIVNGIRFDGVYTSPNLSSFKDKIFYYNKDILDKNLTLRISYIEHVDGMIGNAIVKFEVKKDE